MHRRLVNALFGMVLIAAATSAARATGHDAQALGHRSAPDVDRTEQAAVIIGHVRDEAGQPLRWALVHVLKAPRPSGREAAANPRTSRPAGTASTNSDGGFRISGLAPGDYYVGASTSGSTSPGSVGARSGYAPTFYPGTADVAQAERITVKAGQVRGGLDFSLVRSRSFRVSGVVLDSQQRPFAKTIVTIAPSAAAGGLTASAGSGLTSQDGTFSIPGVVPGTYQIQVVSRASDPERRPMETGRLAITVSNNDLAGLRVTTTPAPPRPIR